MSDHARRAAERIASASIQVIDGVSLDADEESIRTVAEPIIQSAIDAALAERDDPELTRLRHENHEAHAMLTGLYETGWCMTHPDNQPDTELGKAAMDKNVALSERDAEILRLRAQLDREREAADHEIHWLKVRIGDLNEIISRKSAPAERPEAGGGKEETP